MYMRPFATTILFFAVVAIQAAATLETIECSGSLLDVPGLEADCLAVATALSEVVAESQPQLAPYFPPNGVFQCTPTENGLKHDGQWAKSVPKDLLPQDPTFLMDGCSFWVNIINSMTPASVVPVTCGGSSGSSWGPSDPCGSSWSVGTSAPSCDRLKVDDSSSAQECEATASAIDTILASSSKGKKGKKAKSSKSKSSKSKSSKSKSSKSKSSKSTKAPKKGKAAALEAKQVQAVRLEVGAGVALVGMVGFVALVATKL